MHLLMLVNHDFTNCTSFFSPMHAWIPFHPTGCQVLILHFVQAYEALMKAFVDRNKVI
jgi:hypothetical protein